MISFAFPKLRGSGGADSRWKEPEMGRRSAGALSFAPYGGRSGVAGRRIQAEFAGAVNRKTLIKDYGLTPEQIDGAVKWLRATSPVK